MTAEAASALLGLPGINTERAEALARRALRRGTIVMTPDNPDFPIADDIPHGPAVLFVEGRRSEVLRAPRVAVVGTRAASVHGLTDAWELGAFLGAAGISVVSGLAIGVDGAAHDGAIQAAEAAEQRGQPSTAGPVGVLATGLDVVYPRRHRALFERVRRHGVLLGEQPFGVTPERGRFPVRNRIIAALARAVVVVESRHGGGARHTVDAAAARGTPVLAVPGPVRSAGSELPNALLSEGCAPARDALDVLVAVGLSGGPGVAASGRPAGGRLAPRGADAEVLDAVGWEPSGFEDVVVRAGLPPPEVGVALSRLEDGGWIVARGGRWERAR